MSLWVLALLLLIAVGIVVAALLVLRYRDSPSPAPSQRASLEDTVAWQTRREAAARQGSDLIERRVELDLRRGMLGGDASLNDAFDQLQQRLRTGEISAEEFEQEKLRLLGG